MSLDKAIQHGKEKRKKYYGAKAIDKTCRCNGSCLYCRDSRLRHYRKAEIAYKEQIIELKELRKNAQVVDN